MNITTRICSRVTAIAMTPPAAPPAPGPVFYLTPGVQITALSLHQQELVGGTTTGEIVSYNTNTWRETGRQKIFQAGGVLWLDMVDLEGEKTLVSQGRFEGVKMLRRKEEGGEWEEVASFAISHSGFCAGYLHRLQSDLVMAVPSEQSKVLVSRLVQTFIRPLSSLLKAEAGTVMSLAQAEADTGRLLAGYENGEVVLWDWSNNSQVLSVNLAPTLGTIMSLAWDREKGLGAVVGSEDKVVVLDQSLEVVTERKVTNSGLSSVLVREDGKILVTGGWDGRLRVFSWLKPHKLKPLAVLQFHQEAVTSLSSCGSDGGKHLLVAGGKDGKISVWDIY